MLQNEELDIPGVVLDRTLHVSSVVPPQLPQDLNGAQERFVQPWMMCGEGKDTSGL